MKLNHECADMLIFIVKPFTESVVTFTGVYQQA